MTTEPKITALVIRGPFEPEELAEVVALLRQIDDRHGTRDFEIAVVDSNATAIEIGEKLIRDVLPPREGRKTTIFRTTSDDRRG